MSAPAWPPLDPREPRAGVDSRARLVLTVAAWALLAYWMRGALLLIRDWLSHPDFELNTQAAARLELDLVASGALPRGCPRCSPHGSLLGRAAPGDPRAAAIDAAARAARPRGARGAFGLGAADVLSLREPRIVTVRFDASGAIAPDGAKG